MIELKNLLKSRSHTHLIEWLRWTVAPRIEQTSTDADRDRALELARIGYAQINEILRSAIDLRDESTFVELIREWRSTLDAEDRYSDEPDRFMSLREEMDRLVLGLAMWSAHLISRTGPEQGLVATLRAACGHFGSPERVASALQATEQTDSPWTNWFLSELPSYQGHIIPTREALRRAAVLIALQMNQSTAARLPFTRDELLYGSDELLRQLGEVEERADVWAAALGLLGRAAASGDAAAGSSDLPTIAGGSAEQELRDRAASLRGLLAEGLELAKLDRNDEIRRAPLDEAKVASFRTSTLDAHREARVIGDLLRGLAAVETVTDPGVPTPDLHQRRGCRKSGSSLALTSLESTARAAISRGACATKRCSSSSAFWGSGPTLNSQGRAQERSKRGVLAQPERE